MQVRGEPAAKKRQMHTDLAEIKHELADLQVKQKRNHDALHKRIDSLVGSVNHMAQCVDEFNDNYKRIQEAINRSTANDMAQHLDKQAKFPFETREEVYEYIEFDPEMVQLIDR